MNSADFLKTVRVAKPCPANWDEMDGDDRSRFCAQCQKHVYNLSAMTADEAAALIQQKEGDLCGRYFQRADGTILTADCPVGVERWRERAVRSFAAVAALIAFTYAGTAAVLRNEDKLQAPKGSKDRVIAKIEEWKQTTLKWLGLVPPPVPPKTPLPVAGGLVVMGDVCPPRFVQPQTNASLATNVTAQVPTPSTPKIAQ